eukprot:Rmarinus@m.4296
MALSGSLIVPKKDWDIISHAETFPSRPVYPPENEMVKLPLAVSRGFVNGQFIAKMLLSVVCPIHSSGRRFNRYQFLGHGVGAIELKRELGVSDDPNEKAVPPAIEAVQSLNLGETQGCVCDPLRKISAGPPQDRPLIVVPPPSKALTEAEALRNALAEDGVQTKRHTNLTQAQDLTLYPSCEDLVGGGIGGILLKDKKKKPVQKAEAFEEDLLNDPNFHIYRRLQVDDTFDGRSWRWRELCPLLTKTLNIFLSFNTRIELVQGNVDTLSRVIHDICSSLRRREWLPSSLIWKTSRNALIRSRDLAIDYSEPSFWKNPNSYHSVASISVSNGVNNLNDYEKGVQGSSEADFVTDVTGKRGVGVP